MGSLARDSGMAFENTKARLVSAGADRLRTRRAAIAEADGFEVGTEGTSLAPRFGLDALPYVVHARGGYHRVE
jgi:hypothetical protein